MPAPSAAPGFVAPGTPLEQGIERIWAAVLGLERVSIQDSFFELGGHSLLAAELFARLETSYGVRLPLASLFQNSTIERQAQLLQGKGCTRARGSTIVPINRWGGARHHLRACYRRGRPAVRAASRVCSGPEQPFYGLRARGLESAQAIDDLEVMAAGYVDELLQAGFVAPFYLGGFSSGAVVAFEMARQLSLRGHATALLALFDGQAPRPSSSAGRAWRNVEHLPADLREYVADAVRPGQAAVPAAQKGTRTAAWLRRQFAGRPVDRDALDAVARPGLSARHLAVTRAGDVDQTSTAPLYGVIRC